MKWIVATGIAVALAVFLYALWRGGDAEAIAFQLAFLGRCS